MVEDVNSEDRGNWFLQPVDKSYQTVQCHVSEYSNLHRYRRQNLKSHRVFSDRGNFFLTVVEEADTSVSYSRNIRKKKRMGLIVTS